MEVTREVKMRFRVSDIYYYCLFIWIITVQFLHSGITEIITIWGLIYRFITLLVIAIIVIRYMNHILSKRIEYRKLLFGILIASPSLISYFICGRDDLVVITTFIVGSIHTDFKRSLKTILRAQIISVLIIVILSVLGVIENGTFIAQRGDTVVRYALGFAHPNTLAMNVFQIIALIIYTHFEKLKSGHYFALCVLSFVIYFASHSRTSLYISLALIVIIFIYRIFSAIHLRKIWTFIIYNTSKIIILAGIIGSIYLAINFNNGILATFGQYGSLISRFRLLNTAMSVFEVNLFGQYINIVSSSDYYSTQAYLSQGAVLDNSYIYSLLQYGIVNTVWIFFGYYQSIKNARKKKDWAFLICAIAFLIMGFTEKYFVSLIYNFTLLMIGQWLYQYS